MYFYIKKTLLTWHFCSICCLCFDFKGTIRLLLTLSSPMLCNVQFKCCSNDCFLKYFIIIFKCRTTQDNSKLFSNWASAFELIVNNSRATVPPSVKAGKSWHHIDPQDKMCLKSPSLFKVVHQGYIQALIKVLQMYPTLIYRNSERKNILICL